MRNPSILSSIFYICIVRHNLISGFTFKSHSDKSNLYRLQGSAPNVGGISDKSENFDPDAIYVEAEEVIRSRKEYGPALRKNQPLVPVKTHEVTKRINKYDLGLGKNKPIGLVGTAKESNDDIIIEDNQDSENSDDNHAARFWVEHDSINEIPSPLKNDEKHLKTITAEVSGENISLKQTSAVRRISKTRSVPKFPNRISEDVLLIIEQEESKKDDGGPMIVALPSQTKLDVNTAWVQMLIHEQKMQYGND